MVGTMKRAVPALLALLALGEGSARAEVAPGVDAAPPSAPSPKRQVPNYDGRGRAPPTAGETALWVPRVLLSPVYFVTEYVLRQPLSVVIPAAESADVPRKLYDFFTFGPEHNAGFFPVGLYDFGFNPSVGLYAFWDDAGFAGNDWHVHVEVWPSDWLGASLTDRIQIDARQAVQFRVEGLRRPDHVFYGIGPDVPQTQQSRFGEDWVDGSVEYEQHFWRSSRIKTGVGIRGVALYDGHYGDDPSLTAESQTGAFSPPAGFGRGYTAEWNRASLIVDTRKVSGEGSGLRAEMQAEQGNDVRQSPASGWIRYGASAGGYLDLNHHGRVVGLAVTTEFADPLGERPIPFTELPTLGGDGPMRGYFPGRLVDRSLAAAAAHYTWPIAPWIAGTIEAAVGNVFDDHLRGFRPGRLRFSSDIGISSVALGDYPLEAIFGLGSETFERGGTVDSFRVTLSVNHGF
jgi:hypothetical protein